MQPLISVIVPIYKVEKYLDRCVRSILNQTYKNLEIILIDDGSPDRCGEMCDEYTKKDERIRVIHQQNGGLSRARNTGINEAKGEFLSFVDSDDYIEPEMYTVMMEYMQANNLDIVCCDTNIIRGNKSKFKPRYPENKVWTGEEGLDEILSGRLENSVCDKLYNIETVKGVKFPLDRRYEDVATTYKFLEKANGIGYVCKGLYNYIKHSESFIGKSFNSQSRYDCFVAYRERLEYAMSKKMIVEADCRKNAIETSLATLTAFYANNEPENSDRFKAVKCFIEDNAKLVDTNKLRGKHKKLLWAFFNMPVLHKLYALLSGLSKKI